MTSVLIMQLWPHVISWRNRFWISWFCASKKRWDRGRWMPYCSHLYITSKQSTPWELYWFPTFPYSMSSLSLPFLPLSLSLPFPSHTRYSDREHPQKQLTLWAISWSILPPLASTLWRHVPTRSLVSFDNLGHGCPMAKSSLHCSTLPNKVGVVRKS